MTGDSLNVGMLRVPRASDVLANVLRTKILDGELGPGTALPTERTLSDESGLSRGSVRDALRILELEGLVETKPGRNGGTVVRRVEAEPLIRSLRIFIRGGDLRTRSVLELRELIEPECAALAAERASRETVDDLHRLSEDMREQLGDVEKFLTLNVQWHSLVAEASENELLAAIMTAIAPEIREATDLDDFNSIDVVAAAQRAHELVVEAIRNREPAQARRRMSHHVHAYREAVQEHVHSGVHQRASGDDSPREP